MFEAGAFYLFAFLTIAMFWITVTTRHALYALTAIAAGMIFISAFFFILEADFMGVIQLIVYSGAVMALYAFGMMFYDTTRELHEKNPSTPMVFVMGALAAVLVVVMVTAPLAVDNIEALQPIKEGVSNSEAIGMVLFTKYLVPFEVAAVMLLVAMIAGIVMAGKKMDEPYSAMSEEEIDKKEEVA